MKKLLLLLLFGGAIFFSWGPISERLFPEPRVSADPRADVLLFSTSWCRYCDAAREFLIQQGVSYIEFDIENSSDARKQYDLLKGQGVPLIVAKGTIIRGFDKDLLLDALKNAP